ncbi:MAG: hypothetical protein J7513_00065 [Solirubrobacteraceae bacterium]|nr:hypothetical protein [Solirubrobacteraceae bacterium]
MSAALKNRAIRWVAVLYGSASTLDWALGVALMVLVYERTGSSFAAGTMLVCSQVVPAALLFVFGRHTDAWAVRHALGTGFVLQGAAVVALAVTAAPVYAAALIIGCAAAIVRSQLRAGLAQVARGHEFRASNALLNAIRGATSMVGPALAAGLVAVANVERALLVVGISLVVTGVMAFIAPIARANDTAADDEVAQLRSADRSTAVGITPLLLLTGFIIAALSVDEPVLLAYVQHGFDSGVGGYAALLTSWGIGMIAGAAIFASVADRPMLKVFAGAMALSAVAHLGLAVAPTLAFAIACSALGGVANGIDWAALSTAVMERAPRGRESSVASRLEAVATAAPGLGFVVGGALAVSYSPRVVLLVPAIAPAIVVGVLLTGYMLRRRASRPTFSLPVLPAEASRPGVA